MIWRKSWEPSKFSTLFSPKAAVIWSQKSWAYGQNWKLLGDICRWATCSRESDWDNCQAFLFLTDTSLIKSDGRDIIAAHFCRKTWWKRLAVGSNCSNCRGNGETSTALLNIWISQFPSNTSYGKKTCIFSTSSSATASRVNLSSSRSVLKGGQNLSKDTKWFPSHLHTRCRKI